LWSKFSPPTVHCSNSFCPSHGGPFPRLLKKAFRFSGFSPLPRLLEVAGCGSHCVRRLFLQVTLPELLATTTPPPLTAFLLEHFLVIDSAFFFLEDFPPGPCPPFLSFPQLPFALLFLGFFFSRVGQSLFFCSLLLSPGQKWRKSSSPSSVSVALKCSLFRFCDPPFGSLRVKKTVVLSEVPGP